MVEQRGNAKPWQVFVNLAKSIVGAGSFVLPYAFSQMGVWGAIVTIIVAGILCYYTILLLVRIRDIVHGKTRKVNLSYVSLATHTGGKPLALLVYVFTLLTSLGGCGGYLVFIGSTMHSLDSGVSNLAWAGFTSLLLLPLVWVDKIAHLAFTSILGDLALLLGLVATMYRGATATSIQPWDTYDQFDVGTFGYSFGSVCFLMCVQFLFFPIERSLKDASAFPRVLGWTLTFVVIINALFGLFGYFFYGNGVCDIVVLNLGNTVFLKVVKVALCLDLYFTFPVVMAPSREILEKTLHVSGWLRYAFRVVLVGIAFGVSRYSQFGNLTDIIGGICMCSLGFVVPCFMALRMRVPKGSDARLTDQDALLESLADGESIRWSESSIHKPASTQQSMGVLPVDTKEHVVLWVVLVFGSFAVVMTGYFSIYAVVTNRTNPNPVCN